MTIPVNIRDELLAFAAAHAFRGKGSLCVALVVTEHAKRSGLPLDTEALITEGGGQMLGLGKGAVQAILKRHHITRVLAAEGGRTSRGSLGNMREYVSFLNDLQKSQPVDLEEAENFWIELVNQFFAAKPFKLRLDPSKSLRMMIRDLVEQAVDRQKASPGLYYAGALLQHLVGAKLDCALGLGHLEHHSFSTADAPNGRAGDFLTGDVVIHVTTSPGEAVMEKCRDNLNSGYRPVLVTVRARLAVAEGLAANIGIADRIDVFEIEQFVALNLYERGKFVAGGCKLAVEDLITRYNEIVDLVETDPSLRIELRS